MMHEHETLLKTFGLPVMGGLLALLCLGLSLRAGRRRRLVDDLPTSKTTGVFIGLVALKGTAEVEQPLVSYLAGQSCVYYAWQVDERWSRTVGETYTDSQGKTQTRTRTESGWKTVAEGREEVPFYLHDDAGIIRVQPDRAKIEPAVSFDRTCGRSDALYYLKGPAEAVANSDHSRRFSEKVVALHAPLYVVGHAREREDVVAPEIAYDARAEMYLISTRSEEKVSGGYAWQFWLLGVLGLIMGVGAVVLRDSRMPMPPAGAATVHVALGGAYLVLWLVGWVVMAFNSLVSLRQRVRQAWANVDVQLARRHDLIANLVGVVQGLRDYERTVQTELTHMRAQLTCTPPGVPGPDPQAVITAVGVVAERYPALKSDEAFRSLQKNLTDTENRIALARGYFNDIATFFNTRLQIIPDRFLAAMGRFKPQTLMTDDRFERAPVAVSLAS